MASKPAKKTLSSRIPKSIYNVELERTLVTEYNFDTLSKEIDKFTLRASSVRVKLLVDTIRLGTEVRGVDILW